MHTAFLPPSFVFTVILAVPGALAYTVPFESTTADLVLLEENVMPLLYTPAGFTEAFRVKDFPAVVVTLLLLSETEVGVISFTLILIDAVTFLLHFEVAVIVTVPDLIPLTSPESETVAILLLLDL